jgi:hypothetical protein
MADATFTTSAPLETAVLFLVFNRPDTTTQVFQAIRNVKPPRLYIAADGPRAERLDEVHVVARVRDICTSVDWTCEVKTLFRDENLGCKYAVSGAIAWFFEHEEQGIILEDDCLPTQSFFWFCEELLQKYKNDTRIGMICGTDLSKDLQIKESYYFSRYPHIWGWATWRRVWEAYDVELTQINLLIESDDFRRSFNRKMEFEYWRRSFESVRNGTVDTWDTQVVFTMFTQGMLSIYPCCNLVSNIGFGSNATHTKSARSPLSALATQELGWPLMPPRFFLLNNDAEAQRKKTENIGVSTLQRFYRYIKATLKKIKA